MNYLLLDCLILLILLLFALWGRHRGLILSVFSLVALLVAIVGGLVVSKALAPTVTKWVMPLVEDTVVSTVETVIPEEVTEVFDNLAPGETVKDVITELVPEGFVPDENTSLPSMEQIKEYLDNADLELPEEVHNFIDQINDEDIAAIAESRSVEEVVSVAANNVAEVIIRAILFLLTFVLILILWTVLARALDLVSRLPVLNSMNKLGGFIFGLVRGALLLFLVAWVLNHLPTVTEQLIPAEIFEETYILKFFLTVKPLEFLATL